MAGYLAISPEAQRKFALKPTPETAGMYTSTYAPATTTPPVPVAPGSIPEFAGMYGGLEARSKQREEAARKRALESAASRGLEISGVVGAEMGKISGEQQTALMEAEQQLALSEAMARREERMIGEERQYTSAEEQRKAERDRKWRQEDLERQIALEEANSPGWLGSLVSGMLPAIGYAVGGPIAGAAIGGLKSVFSKKPNYQTGAQGLAEAQQYIQKPLQYGSPEYKKKYEELGY